MQPWDPSKESLFEWLSRNGNPGPEELGQIAATWPADVQKQVAGQLTDRGRKAFIASADSVRQEAFRNEGERLPGVTASGHGQGVDRHGRAIMLEEQNILDIEEATGSQPGVDAYTYRPEMDEGIDWRPQDQYSRFSDLSPMELAEQAAAIDQTRSDTTGIDAQKDVLQEYDSLYNQGGLNAIDRARMAQSRRIRGAQARGQEEAIMADAAEQGRGGGNMALVGRLIGQQGAANRMAQDDLETQAMALSRRDAILRDRSSLGGGIQSAQDAIDRFNTEGERTRVQQDLDRRNEGIKRQSEREEEDVSQRNKGVDTSFDYESGLSERNTDRTNDANKLNVSSGYGERGHFEDKVKGAITRSGARSGAGAVVQGVQRAKDEAADAAKAAWGNAIVGGVEVVGGGVATALGGGAVGAPVMVDGARRLGRGSR